MVLIKKKNLTSLLLKWCVALLIIWSTYDLSLKPLTYTVLNTQQPTYIPFHLLQC